MHITEAFLDQLLTIAEEAGRAILQHYDAPEVEYKDDGSPLTAADLAADRIIEAALARLFPEVLQVSEERVDQVSALQLAGRDFFCIDPLDGTRMFLKRNGQFTVNIALIRNGRPAAGVIHAPATGESWVGAEGVSAWKVARGARKSLNALSPRDPAGLVLMVSPDEASTIPPEFLGGMKIARRLAAGSSLKFCRIAEGLADLYPRTIGCMEWDVAAGHAILRAAGGHVLTLSGEELTYGHPRFWAPKFVAYGRPGPTTDPLEPFYGFSA